MNRLVSGAPPQKSDCLAMGFALLLSMALFGCGGDDSQNGPMGGERYLPHADGIEWTFTYTEAGQPKGQLVAKMDGSRALLGLATQRLVVSSQTTSGEVWTKVDANGAVLQEFNIFDTSLFFDPPIDFLPFPFEVGDKFKTNVEVNVGLLRVQVDSETTVAGFGVATAAGRSYPDSFRLETAYEVRVLNLKLKSNMTSWLAPDVGLVRGQVEIPDNPVFPVSGTLTLELESMVLP